ncbi:MAG: hypothetical protein H0V95_03460 [Actinobacteria bacterium]|nr:hypothetical protein [Actinomycetota bacterium]
MPEWETDDTSKPAAPLWAKLFVLGLFAVGAWIALSFVFAIVGRALALAGYVIVAIVAYFIGKAVGSASKDE